MVFLPFILIIVVMYFLMIRPQSKRQKEHQAMLAALEKGDKIVSTGGILGTIVGIKEAEKTLIVKISENTKIELSRNAVATVVKKRSQ
jgi:preprotein translocase subunit YajC